MKKLEVRGKKLKVRKIIKDTRFILLISLFLLLTSSLFANFIGMNWGARPMAMGEAYVALADDPSAVFWNPAGLAKISQYSLVASHQNLYGVQDLYNEMVAVSIPLPKVRTGFGWTQINLLNEYSEQVISLSGASIIWIKNFPIRFGVSLKNTSANVSGYSNIDCPSTGFIGVDIPGKFDMDIGLLANPGKKLSVGFSVRNLIERTFSFINSEDKIARNYALGLCYHWRDVVNFLADYNWDNDNSSWHLGGEMWFFDVFAPRIGVCGDNLTAGFGIRAKNWNVDGAVLAHDELGSTYRISVGLRFGGR
ncbi:hypothetical protein DRP43_03385 [candidate division TA06 bacterium]|uniref:PorV/PorQ family protein n=1 Tax=candidate division TA06 bacterium TaxID=2250710 RepID=A0A660SHU1_UNCT6|nr:MAG: hypothetical protein DRP43_03385 [candidate division TA06 bacterium]